MQSLVAHNVQEAIPTMRRKLARADDDFVQGKILIDLAQLNEDVTELALFILKNNPKVEMRRAAARALGYMKDAQRVVPILNQRLCKKSYFKNPFDATKQYVEPDKLTRIYIVFSLGRNAHCMSKLIR